MSLNQRIRLSCLLLCCLLSLGSLFAQRITPVANATGGKPVSAETRAKMMCTSDAGEVAEIDNFTGNSISLDAYPDVGGRIAFDDYDQDTIFLCVGDGFTVDMDNSTIDLSGDPRPASEPGIGYAIYECPPQVAGTTRADWNADPCITNDGLFPLNGPAIAVPPGYFANDYELTFANTGTAFQALYPNDEGLPGPIVLYFAPITVDSFDSDNNIARFDSDPMTGEVGPCVNINIQDYLTVAYLNAITLSDAGVTVSDGCRGQFEVRGGLPELQGNAGYTITIVNEDNGDIGTLLTDPSAIRHATEVEYIVPSPGTYRINIEDGVSCGLNELNPNLPNGVTIDHTEGCATPPSLTFECGTGDQGQNICVSVTAEFFTDVFAFNFAFDYDPTVLDFTNGGVTAPELAGGNATIAEPATGTVSLTYEDFGNSASVADGNEVVELCFDVIGAVGSESPITIRGDLNRSVTVAEDDGTDTEFSGEEFPITTCPFRVVSTELAFTVVQDSVTCAGDSDGSLTVTPTGGTAPYTVTVERTNPNPMVIGTQTVNNPFGAAQFNNLIAGFYTVTVTDAAGASVQQEQVRVFAPASFFVDVLPEQTISCNGEADAVIFVDVVVGNITLPDINGAGYNIIWTRTGTPGVLSTEDTLRNLGEGTYVVTIINRSSGCEATASITLQEPDLLFIDVAGASVTDATCSGANDGAITVAAGGGTPSDPAQEYTFRWSDNVTVVGQNTTRTGLLPGNYTVTVIDENDCTDSFTFIVSAEKTVGFNPDEIRDISCFGEADGRISGNVTVTGPFDPTTDLPYSIRLTNLNTAAVDTDSAPDNNFIFTFDNLGPGDYELLILDGEGCFFLDTLALTEPDLLEITDIATTDETCEPAMGGTVTVTVAGGTAPYSLNFTNRAEMDPLDTTITTFFLDDLRADTTYQVEITDANGCMVLDSFRIFSPAGAIIEPIDTSFISCPNETDGQLTANFTLPNNLTVTLLEWYILFDNGTISASPVATTATTGANLAEGNYVLQITTSNGCISQAIGRVQSPGPVVLGDPVITQPICPDQATGFIELNVSGGTAPYTFVWSDDPNGPGTTNPIFGPVVAGTYSVTVTDANDCAAVTATYTVEDPPRILGDFVLTPVSCPDDLTADGAATFNAFYEDNSPVNNFVYQWTLNGEALGASGPTVTDLTRGVITVIVSDGTCFSEQFTDTIRSPEEFEVLPVVTDVSCFGSGDGAITIGVTGGTPDYTFDWVGQPDMDNTLDNLTAGDYTVNITDANGCVAPPATITVSEPDELELSLLTSVSTPSVRCFGDENGRIGVFVSSQQNNDFPDNPYRWSANVSPTQQEDSLAFDLGPGIYGVTVTDVRGCQDSLTYQIVSPDPIDFIVAPIAEPLCNNGLTDVVLESASGGSAVEFGDYTFEVNRDGFRIPAGQTGVAFAGDITVTVYDTIGCSATQEYFVDQPPPIIVDLPERIVIELGDSTALLDPIISPAGDVYSYLWTPAEFLTNDTIRSPRVFPLQTTDYTLMVTNSNGCEVFADITVEVDANRNVYIPNVFSPNRDGRNDDFRIYACRGVQEVTNVKIFDRWGGLVRDAQNIPPNCLDGIPLWNGIGQNGKAVNPGVFVYIVEVQFLDDVKLLYRGDITVLR